MKFCTKPNRGVHLVQYIRNFKGCRGKSEILQFLRMPIVKGAVSRFYCASKICANLKNCLPTINQVRSEIRYTIYNPFVMQDILALF